MRSLTRMFFAEFFRLWRQGVAIVGLLACGIAIFVMSTGMIRALETSRDRYYRDKWASYPPNNPAEARRSDAYRV